MSSSPRVVLALVLAGAMSGRTRAEPVDGAKRLAVAERIHALAQQYFAHWEGVERGDIEAAFDRYRAEATASTDEKQFQLATLRFVAALRNGHTQFIDERADARPLKFRLIDAGREWMVFASQQAGLPRGAIVQTIDGKPAGAVIRDLAQYVAASNERLARTHVFSYPMLFGERIRLGLKDGSAVVIDRSIPVTGGPAIARSPEGRWLIDGVTAYIKVPSFGDSAFESGALDLVRAYQAAANLIVDVRGNGGGTTPGQLIEALMNRRWRTWQQNGRPARDQAPSATAYGGRLFLLVDRFCGSACEDFVMPFKDTQRAILIGETTQGSSGNPYRADLGDGMRIAIGAVRYRFPNGAAFEGVGIEPDVTVPYTPQDLQAGRDAMLERARRLAAARQ
jgi:carboxyl-terminal processing protease